MPTVLDQRLLFHGREEITNKIDEIQKRNHKKNISYTQFYISFFCFLLSPPLRTNFSLSLENLPRECPCISNPNYEASFIRKLCKNSKNSLLKIFYIFRLYSDVFQLWGSKSCVLLVVMKEMSQKMLKNSKWIFKKLQITVRRLD
jgi:hypothetical protein